MTRYLKKIIFIKNFILILDKLLQRAWFLLGKILCKLNLFNKRYLIARLIKYLLLNVNRKTVSISAFLA